MPAKATYSAGTAYLSVVPSMLGIEKAMEQQVRQMAEKVDKDLATAMSKGMRDAARQSEGVGKKAGEDFAGAYEREAKKHLNAAWRSLPEPEPDIKLRKWDKSLNVVRKGMKELAEQRIGVDIDHKTFDTAVEQFRQRLTVLRNIAPKYNTSGFFNAQQAEAALAQLEKFTTETARRGAHAGDEFGGAFITSMQRVLRDGADAIPPMKIDADSTPAERKIAELQGRMRALADKRIGVDLDAATAYAELVAIRSELQKLDRRDVRVDIRTNAHEAAAGMGRFIEQAEQAGQSTQNIGNSATFSLTRLGHLIALGASLGSVVVPAAMAAAAAIGTVGTAAAAGLSGVGVFALGLSGVADTVKALNKYENDQAKSANSVNQANRRMASSADQVRMAEMSLANTRRNVSEAAQDSARRVADAERNVGEVRRQNRRDAVDAARAVTDSQRALTREEEDARDVRRQLNDAIAEAVRNMAELDTALGRNDLEQRKTVTAQKEALEALNRLKENPRATEIELRRARESYDEQTQRLKELRDEQKRLADDRARGVEGDDQVVAARKRIAASDEQVAAARERLDRAREAQQEQAYQGARRLADSQRQVADAQRAQARQQLDGQYQLAQASKAVESAKRAEQQAWEKTGIAGGEALNNLNWQMSQLSPEAQHFSRFIFGLKDEVLGLREAAAAPLLPRLEEAITGLLPYVPALGDYIGRVSTKLGDLSIAAVDSLGNPVWQRFFGYIDANAVPSLQMMYDVGSNLTQGLLSLFLAMTPFDKPFGQGLVGLSQDFAQWAANLENTQGYQDFLDAVRERGPEVLHFLAETGELLIKLIEAGGPLGTLMLHTLTIIADTLNSFPMPVLQGMVFTFGLLGLTLSTLSGIMRAKKIGQDLTGLFGPRMSSMVTTYAIETGRATEETGRFRTATATAAGAGAAFKTRLSEMGQAAFGADSRLRGVAGTARGEFTAGLDAARLTTFNAALALNGPGGLAGAAVAAKDQVLGVGKAANDATNPTNRLRVAALNAGVAFNGPAGLAGGVVTAGQKLKDLGGNASRAATKGLSAVVRGAGSLVGFLGGPWGVALLGAGLAIDFLTSRQSEQKQKVGDLVTALGLLGDAYRETGSVASSQVQNVVSQNRELQTLISTANTYGLSLQDVAAAAAGEEGAQRRVIAALEEKRRVIAAQGFDDQLSAMGADNSEVDRQVEAIDRIIEAQKQRFAQTNAATAAQNALTAAQQRALNSTGPAELAQLALADAMKVLADNTATAAQKAQALKAAEDALTGAARSQEEAELAYEASLDNVTGALTEKNNSLDRGTAAGRANRQMVADLLTKSVELYNADRAGGMSIQEATKRHQDRIAALKEEAAKTGVNSGKLGELIGLYGQVPPEVETMLKMTGDAAVQAKLDEFNIKQKALDKNISIAESRRLYEKDRRIAMMAEGGRIVGPGTGTSDDVPIWASNGEFMQPTKSVDYYGPDFMEALRRRAIPKDALPGFADGGLIGGQPTKGGLPAYARGGKVDWPFVYDLSKTLIPAVDELGGATGGPGWKWQMAVLREAFPGLALYSGFRRNSYTASGSLSWHSRDGGRAVDVPPRQDVFNYIHDRYGKGTKELIWGGDPDRNIYGGKHHRFDDALLRAHGPYKGKAGPSPHLHWAFDEGGQLMPGWNVVPNFTGKPEPVLSPSQWQVMEEFVTQGMVGGRSGNTYQFEFANTTLDEQRIRDMQRRDDALARADRDNY